MKKLIIFLVIFVGFACSPFSIKKEKKIGSVLSQLKSSGVIVRLPSGAMIKIEDYINTLSYWLEGYDLKNSLKMIQPGKESIFYSLSDYDRFYQLSEDEKFLTYKSIGVISIFLRDNKEELKKIMTEKGLDSFIIYEVDSSYTLEMQFYDFVTALAIVDSNFNIIYLDHQNNVYDIEEMDSELVRRDLIDKISERFIKSMFELDYITKRKDSIKPQNNVNVVEEKVPEEIKPAEDTKEPQPVSKEKTAAEPVVKQEVKKADESGGSKNTIPSKSEKPAEGSKTAEPEKKMENSEKGAPVEPAK